MASVASLHAEAQRLDLMVDITYTPGTEQHWVTAFEGGSPEPPAVLLTRPTYDAAIAAAVGEMRGMSRRARR